MTISTIPQLRPVSQEGFLAAGMLVPTPGTRGLGTAKESHVMLAVTARREAIAAVETYKHAYSEALLPHQTVQLLSVRFASGDVCQRSLQDLAAEGFDRKRLAANLRRLVEAGFLSREPGSGAVPDTYRLHLAAVQP